MNVEAGQEGPLGGGPAISTCCAAGEARATARAAATAPAPASTPPAASRRRRRRSWAPRLRARASSSSEERSGPGSLRGSRAISKLLEVCAQPGADRLPASVKVRLDSALLDAQSRRHLPLGQGRQLPQDQRLPLGPRHATQRVEQGQAKHNVVGEVGGRRSGRHLGVSAAGQVDGQV